MNNKSKSKSESIQEILDVLCKEKVARCYSINSNCDFFTSEKKNDKETAWLFNILSDRLSIPNGEVIEMSDTNITIWSSKSFNSILRVLLNKIEPIYHISTSPEEPTGVKILKWSEYKLLHEPCKRAHLTTKNDLLFMPHGFRESCQHSKFNTYLEESKTITRLT